MLRLTNLAVPLDYDDRILRQLILRKLSVPQDQLVSFALVRRSIDARDKADVHFVMSFDLCVKDEASALKRCRSLAPSPQNKPPRPLFGRFNTRPLVVGAGPAGLFAALTLVRSGAAPILIERGKPVDERTNDVSLMAAQGILEEDSNVQFGEGGAGAFSDGKLTCGVKSPYTAEILETFVKHGAPAEILTDQMPHIGTDRLKKVVSSLREEIRASGGTVLFETRLEELILRSGHVEGAVVSHAGKKREILTDTVLLCIGHSARDTVQNLFTAGIRMTQKPFAVGVRIEHLRSLIDRSQYGSFAGHPALNAASYKLICHTKDGRGVYTFCMCPGGSVIAAASQPGGVVTNGMSLHARDGENSNSALLVGVRTEDFGDTHPLAGFVFQRELERAAFRAGGGDFRAPAQRVEDFLCGRPTSRFGDVVPSYRPGVTPADLREILPGFIAENLKTAIPVMDRQLHGFALPDAVLTGPETRSSSPVRFSRDETGQAEGISGLFPVGEGAGYAGGIVSAAIDGIASARKVIERSLLL
ncbi:MAG: hypothetical protein IKH18_07040 [Clostridia bacterium]|nr:hypothetical protein [Clostridia bacterium]